MTFRSLAASATLVLSLLAVPLAAQEKALRIQVSNGMKAAIEELQPECERAIGRPLSIQFNSTASVKKKIEAGETFDATIITVEAIDDLIKQGKLAGNTRTNLVRSQLGIGIRAGAPKPDIHTTAALKQTLLKANSITYPQDGASRGFIEQMFERMGIAGDIKSKIILAPGSGPATESVAAGKADMVITLFSEIVPTKGAEILGPLPGEFQSDVRFAAAASSSTKNAEAAKALIAFLAGPKTAAVYKAKGLEHIK